MKRHRPEDHKGRCYCGRPATFHIMYGSGCGNVCGIHRRTITRRKGGPKAVRVSEPVL